LLLTLGGVASLASSVVAPLYLLGAGCYLVAAAYASTVSASRYGWDLLPILPVVFLTYHTSYGLGFTHGFIDFVLRAKDPSRMAKSVSVSRGTRHQRNDKAGARAA
jgi:hypothetical protein